jgi:hypothetical protein
MLAEFDGRRVGTGERRTKPIAKRVHSEAVSNNDRQADARKRRTKPIARRGRAPDRPSEPPVTCSDEFFRNEANRGESGR